MDLKEKKVNIEDSWYALLESEFSKPYFLEIKDFIKSEYKTKTIYPHPKYIFNAFNSTPVENVKVVIIGQDPYHGPDQAHGLCFSVLKDIKKPPSLVNIFKEIESDLGVSIPLHGNLQSWADQGVLLTNRALTVQKGRANSHKSVGWDIFTDKAIEKISLNREKLVFLLWGNHAHKKAELIDSEKHLILKAPHPSPLSAYNGFFGCKHFSKANDYLVENSISPINWSIH